MNQEVVSVNISEKKGTVKKAVPFVVLDKKGIVGDAHAGSWHRQVSLLAQERIDDFARDAGRSIAPGEFAENITTSGIDLAGVNLLDRLKIAGVELEVTKIGKECHGEGCAIYRQTGKCIMPEEGIFCRVVNGGKISPGDLIEHIAVSLNVRVIVLSDRAASGEYEDKSGPRIKSDLESFFAGRRWNLEVEIVLIPDNADLLRKEIESACANGAAVIFTSGGTGIGPRDITTDTLRGMLDKEIPGIMEYIRVKYGEKIPGALLSRSVAGAIGNTLVYALPGSVKAVAEYTGEILRTLEHSIFMLNGIDNHCL